MKVFKISSLFILLLINFFVSAMRPEQRLNKLKSELNAELGLSESADIYTIVVTRTPNQAGQLPLISHREFEQVLKLLYASCVYPGSYLYRWWTAKVAAEPPSYSQNGILLNEDIDNNPVGLSSLEKSSIASTIQQIGRYFVSNNMQDMCKLVVFNEMFFSQMEPLENTQKNFIENYLITLSNDSPNTFLYPNFLYTEQKQVTGSDLHNNFLEMQNAANVGDMVIAPSALKRCRVAINGIPNDNTVRNHSFLINETYSINRGRLLTRCRKHGYFYESDESINRGVLYNLGLGYDEPLGTPSSLQEVLLHNITTDICLDLNLGVRKRRVQWENPAPSGSCDSSLHIIQSNSIDPFYDPDNIVNLPTMRGIVHADKFPHPSWNAPDTNRPQDIFLPYYDGINIMDDIVGSKEEFHLRFVGNDYRFTFQKI